MKYFLFSLCLAGLLLANGCQQANKTNSSLVDTRSGDQIIPAKTLTQTLTSYRFVPLETTPESFIGDIHKILKKGNRFYISTFSDRRFYIFGNDGEFITQLNKKGNGPEEYAMIVDFDIFDNQIAILDSRKIMIYSAEDQPTFIKSIPLDFTPRNIKCINSNTFCIYTSSPDAVFYIVDKNGEVINKGAPGNQLTRVFSAKLFQTLYNGDVCIKYGSSNDLVAYHPDRNQFYPLTLFPKGEFMPLEQELEYVKQHGMNYGDKIDIEMAKINICGNHVITTLNRSFKEYRYYISDLKTGKIKSIITSDTRNDLNYTKHTFLNNTSNSDWEEGVIGYLHPFSLKEIVEKNTAYATEEAYKQLSILSATLKEEDNPILIELIF